MKLHKLPDTVEHVMVFSCSTGHLLDYGGHMTEYCRVQQS